MAKLTKNLLDGSYFNNDKSFILHENAFIEYIAISDKSDVEVTANKNEDSVRVNEPIIVDIEVKNNGNSPIKFSPSFFNEPKEDGQYIIRHQCPCHQRFSLDAKESKRIKIVYEVDKSAIIDGKSHLKLFFVF